MRVLAYKPTLHFKDAKRPAFYGAFLSGVYNVKKEHSAGSNNVGSISGNHVRFWL
jgi:hypothetical protein